MKRKAIGVMVALAATTPAIVLPALVAPAQAQPAGAAPAEYPDVPRGHWAYEAINKLSQAGILEGMPDGTYMGGKSMTRYEFAVAIARLLQKIPTNLTTQIGPPGPAGPPGPPGPIGPGGGLATAPDLSPYARRDQLPDFNTFVKQDQIRDFIKRAEVNDLIAALRNEFSRELERMGVRIDALEGRVANLENRKPVPPRFVASLGIIHRTGTNAAIQSGPLVGFVNPVNGQPVLPGRQVANGNNGIPGALGTQPTIPGRDYGNQRARINNTKFSYTDFELRLSDRISDRLSASAALRSSGNTQEDAWAGETLGGLYLREAYAAADLTDKKVPIFSKVSAVIGRHHHKIAQGLLYDNDLSPTDQGHVMANIGPVKFGAFLGSTDGSAASGLLNGLGNTNLSLNPYLSSGAVAYLGDSGIGNLFQPSPGSAALPAGHNGALVGIPVNFGVLDIPVGGFGNPGLENNESGLRASANIFKLGGKPVSLGFTKLLSGVAAQEGYSFDATVPLFKREIGIEWVTQQRQADGIRVGGNPNAYNITLPVLKTKIVDLDVAYGSAESGYEHFIASSANPFARTWGEAVFDRPLALGAPLINGNAFGGAGGNGLPTYVAAKRAFDVSGTVRVPISFLRRTPIDFRYYKAGGKAPVGVGGFTSVDLGDVYTVGTTFNVTSGLDFEVKYGVYNVPGPVRAINYLRFGANVNF